MLVSRESGVRSRSLLNSVHWRIECYYCVNAEYRGKGIAVEATKALLAALAPALEVRAYCHPDNKAAHQVAKRCGMKQAGMARHRHAGFEDLVVVYTGSQERISRDRSR